MDRLWQATYSEQKIFTIPLLIAAQISKVLEGDEKYLVHYRFDSDKHIIDTITTINSKINKIFQSGNIY